MWGAALHGVVLGVERCERCNAAQRGAARRRAAQGGAARRGAAQRGLVAAARLLDEQHRLLEARGELGRGQAGGAASDDDQVVVQRCDGGGSESVERTEHGKHLGECRKQRMQEGRKYRDQWASPASNHSQAAPRPVKQPHTSRPVNTPAYTQATHV